MTTDKYHNTTSNYNHVKTEMRPCAPEMLHLLSPVDDTWREAIISPMVKETDILMFILLETSAVSLDTIY
jgi:hypothetical protein